MENNRIIIQTIQNILKQLRNDGITDPFQLEVYFIEHYTYLFDEFPALIKRLCREENQDNSFLYKMLDTLDKVNKGDESMASAELKLGDELAQKFIYPFINKSNE
jgi:hypothetical protein